MTVLEKIYQAFRRFWREHDGLRPTRVRMHPLRYKDLCGEVRGTPYWQEISGHNVCGMTIVVDPKASEPECEK